MADAPVDLSPFRSMVSFSADVQYAWYMDYDVSHTHEGFSSTDEAERDQKYQQYLDWYGDDPEHFVEKDFDGTFYSATVYHAVQSGTLKLGEPEDWTAPPHDDDYYSQYFTANQWNTRYTKVLNVEWRSHP